jgi:hypothetical protein
MEVMRLLEPEFEGGELVEAISELERRLRATENVNQGMQKKRVEESVEKASIVTKAGPIPR